MPLGGMSLTSPRLTPVPSHGGAAFTIEQLPEGKRRIIRRWLAPADVTNLEQLIAGGYVEPWGTPDAGFDGDGARGVADCRQVYPEALLVEARLVPAAAQGHINGDPTNRILEKIYEETPYTVGGSTRIAIIGGVSYGTSEVCWAENQPLDEPAGTVTATGGRREFGRIIRSRTLANVTDGTELSRTVRKQNNGALTLTTVRTLNTSSNEPGVEVSRSTEKADAYTIYERTTAVGSGEIAREQSLDNQGKLIRTTTRTIATAKPAAVGVQVSASSVLEDGWTVWTVVGVSGSGEFAREERLIDVGQLALVTTRTLATAEPAAVGTKVSAAKSEEAGYTVWTVAGIAGGGRAVTGFDEDGDGIIYEEGRETSITEPTDPAPGVYLSWRKTARDGYWEQTWRRLADDQLGATQRQRKNTERRPDGSLVIEVTEYGTDPACDSGEADAIQVAQTELLRYGGIIGRTKRYVVAPASRTVACLVQWRQPGEAVLQTAGGNVTLFVRPYCDRVLLGQQVYQYGTGGLGGISVPWQITSGFYYTVIGAVSDKDGNVIDISKSESIPMVVGDMAYTGAPSTWMGATVVDTITLTGSSTPSALPSGPFITNSWKRPYFADLNTGVITYEIMSESATR